MNNYNEIIKLQNEALTRVCKSQEDIDNFNKIMSGKYRNTAESKIFLQGTYENKLNELFKYMKNNFKYIDKFVKSKNHGWDVRMYTCKEFEKYGGGCCHDFANYIYYKFNKLKPIYNLIFVSLYYGYIVHSYISFQDKYLMEFISSNTGLTKFKDKKSMISTMGKHLLTDFDIDKEDVTGTSNYIVIPPNTSDSYLEFCETYKHKGSEKTRDLFRNKNKLENSDLAFYFH